jgi:hypothetical protein
MTDPVAARDGDGEIVVDTVTVAIEVDEAPFDNDDVGDTCRLLLPD